MIVPCYCIGQGDPTYILGSPLFASVSITTSTGTPLVISAINQSTTNVYVQSVSWNGKPVAGVSVSYYDIIQGGSLQFVMGATPPS